MIRIQRVATGLGVGAAALGVIAVDHWTGTAWLTCLLVIAALGVALSECYGLLIAGGQPVDRGAGVGATLLALTVRAFGEPLGLAADEAHDLFLVLMALVFVLPIGLAIARPREDGPSMADVRRVAATAFAALYVGYLGSFLLELRLLPDLPGHESSGLALAFLLAAAVKIADSCAYFVGRTIGRHPMCWVSPKKTWEGSAASILGSVAVCYLLGSLVFGYDWRVMVGMGVIADLAGQGGDLAESWLKRAVGAKDSASTFGEMGGVLDMIDALLLAAPPAWFWLQLTLYV